MCAEQASSLKSAISLTRHERTKTLSAFECEAQYQNSAVPVGATNAQMSNVALTLVCLAVSSGAVLFYLARQRRTRHQRASMPVQRYSIREHAVGLLLGGAIGDAMGIAYDGQQVLECNLA